MIFADDINLFYSGLGELFQRVNSTLLKKKLMT